MIARRAIQVAVVLGLVPSSLVVAVSGRQGTGASGTSVIVQLLAINEFHGNLEPPSSGNGRIGDATAGGAEYLATHLKEDIARNPNTIVVAAGDLIGASPLVSALFHDEPTIESMNAMNLAVTSVGNHEFDRGGQELLRMQNGGCHPKDGCQNGQRIRRRASFSPSTFHSPPRSRTALSERRSWEITRAANAAGESALGDLIADAQLAAAAPSVKGGAVVAFVNAGGIRGDLTGNGGAGGAEPRAVTYNDLFAIQPFGNVVTVMTLNDFLAAGGSGFTVFKEGTARLGGDLDVDALVAYVKPHSPLSAGPRNRIVRIE